LTTRQSIRRLEQALGPRLAVFPYGGHLGNLWYPDNKDYMLRIPLHQFGRSRASARRTQATDWKCSRPTRDCCR
jgi:hypothetical protein